MVLLSKTLTKVKWARLRAVVAAGGEYVTDIQIFLVEKCHRLLEIKGFGHKFPNNLRIRASLRPHN